MLVSDGTATDKDWKDYRWAVVATTSCSAGPICISARAKWDWKRPQWVEFSAVPSSKGLEAKIRLINEDRKDDDNVCITVLFLSSDGSALSILHKNLHSLPQAVRSETVDIALRASLLRRISSIALGTKQCRRGPHEDDDVYRRAKARLKMR